MKLTKLEKYARTQRTLKFSDEFYKHWLQKIIEKQNEKFLESKKVKLKVFAGDNAVVESSWVTFPRNLARSFPRSLFVY